MNGGDDDDDDEGGNNDSCDRRNDDVARRSYGERAEEALVRVLTKFPMVLPKLLSINKVDVHMQQSSVDDASAAQASQATPDVAAPASIDDDEACRPPLTSAFSPALARYAQCDPSEYEDAFRTFPPEAIALDPNIVAPAVALGPNDRRRGRFLRRNRQHRGSGGGGEGVDDGPLNGRDPGEVIRQLLGMGGDEAEVLDPDSPLLQLYLQSLLPWARVEGVRPPRGG